MTILIADDDKQVQLALSMVLKLEGYEVHSAYSPAQVISACKQQDIQLVLLDMNFHQDTTSGQEGLALIKQLQQAHANIPIVAMTGFGSIGLAVEAVKLGAKDFIEKPWCNEKLLTTLGNQLTLQQSQQQLQRVTAHNQLLMDQLGGANQEIVANSMAMQQILDQLTRLAKSDMNILLTGENGTGKSMLAQWVHQQSLRNEQPFVAVNMGGISDTLFESELFGHVRGAFTDAKTERVGRFEMASGGTLFMDEIANVSLPQQAKLLRVLEEKQFEKVGSSHTQHADVRIISATNAELATQIAEGTFREDLFYRLKTIEIRVPALRERKDDILPLANYFQDKFNRKYQMACEGFTDDAVARLQSYAWPGNTRELSHIVERAIFLSESAMISAVDLALGGNDQSTEESLADFSNATLEEIEKHLILARVQRLGENPNKAAESLGLSRSAYYRRLEKYQG